MLGRSHRKQWRSGAALVETAAVVSVFLMFLFGVVEYCRLLFTKQLIDNAAREGARYAVVHTYDSTVDADTQTQIYTKMSGYDKKLRNFTIQLYHADNSGNRVTSYDSSGTAPIAFASDSGGKYLLDGSNNKSYMQTNGTGTYVTDSSNNKIYLNLNTTTSTVTGVNAGQFSSYVSSNQIQGVDSISNAKFGEYVCVHITCDYDPITPAFLRFGQTFQVGSKSLMYSEAN